MYRRAVFILDKIVYENVEHIIGRACNGWRMYRSVVKQVTEGE